MDGALDHRVSDRSRAATDGAYVEGRGLIDAGHIARAEEYTPRRREWKIADDGSSRPVAVGLRAATASRHTPGHASRVDCRRHAGNTASASRDTRVNDRLQLHRAAVPADGRDPPVAVAGEA